MADSLSLGYYVIIKPRMLTRKFDIRDKEGKTLFEAKPNLLGTELTISDMNGKNIGETKHKILALAPTFYLYDGNAKSGKLLGVIKKPILQNTMRMTQKLTIEDEKGNALATASGGFLALGEAATSYNIEDGRGETIATVSSQVSGSIMGWLGDMAKDAYCLQISRSDSIPTLVLIEFLLCIELMRQEQNRGAGVKL
jgi:uncharacterized protein YxjI